MANEFRLLFWRVGVRVCVCLLLFPLPAELFQRWTTAAKQAVTAKNGGLWNHWNIKLHRAVVLEADAVNIIICL